MAGGRVRGFEATRLYRSVMKPVYWCVEERVLGVGGVGCSGGRVPLRLTQPGDVRPAFPRDVEVVREALEYSVGRGAAGRLLPGGMVYLNRVQGPDAADEVVAGGVLVGVRLFDVLRGRWVFKPDWDGAVLVVEESLGFHAWVRGRLRPGVVLGRGDVESGDLPDPEWGEGFYVALGARGGWYGVGKVTRMGLRVVRAWRRRGPPREPVAAAGREGVLEAYEDWLERLEGEAVGFLRRRVSGLGDVWVAVSGGRDSAAAAVLAVKAGFGRAYFLDTGIEFPETVEAARGLADRLGLRLEVIEAGNAFWEALEVFGPPARDYRWCCKVVKFAPLARALPRLARGRLVAVTGQRAFESTQRAASPRIAPGFSTMRWGSLLAAPIQEWTALEVTLYLWREGVPLNPVYEWGYERVGCYPCPSSRLAEIAEARRRHPGLWGEWEGYLRRYARRRGLPAEWVEYGFWRWRFKLPGDMEAVARRLGLKPQSLIERIVYSHVVTSIDYSPSGECVTLNLLDVDFDWREVRALLKTTGLEGRATLHPDGTIEARDPRTGAVARLHPNATLEVCAPTGRAAGGAVWLARRLLAPAYMAGACYGCEACAAACPTGAMVAAHTLNPDKCTGCSSCTYACPASGKLALHALHALRQALGHARVPRRRAGRRASGGRAG